MINLYRARPVTVEATHFLNETDLHEMVSRWGEEFSELVHYDDSDNTFTIDHESGVMNVKPGDWVVRGTKKGDFYPADEATFTSRYELATQ
jgi:hypothetical protein